MRMWKNLLSVAVLLLSTAAIGACGSSSSNSSTTSTSSAAASGTSSAATSSAAAGSNAAIAALVPAADKSKTITVAADATYAPNEFIAPDGHTVIGMDPDLVHAMFALMGLKANIVNATFDTIIPGLAAGKYEMGASSFGDTKAREKVVNFVDYYQAGTSFFTKSSGGASISGLADLCGKSVSVESGTTEEADAKTQSGKCKAAGKPGVNVLVYPTQTAANLALSSGRAQISMADSPVAEYQVKQSHGNFKLVGTAYGVVPYGFALPKSSRLAPAMVAALKVLIHNGTYSKILAKWGIQNGAIPASRVKVNGAVS
jgi:polar amino acid transport system substrate-binding protein